MANNNIKKVLRGLFFEFPWNIALSFWKYNLVLHIIAIALTYFIVTGGMDWSYFNSSTDRPTIQFFLFPAVVLGGIIPIVLPITMYIIGRKRKNPRTINTAFALGQAVIVANIIVSVYKAITGRVPPPEVFDKGPFTDVSQEFRFGFLNGGIFNGWPSGHTTTAFAMALVLIKLYPENKRIRYLGLTYAIYIGLGISTNIHWLSDFIAGIFVGIGVGLTVGGSFWKRYSSRIK